MPTIKVNDVNLFYEIKGNENAKETIVFLNGVMATTNSWAFQVKALEKLGMRILLHDFRGQLKSDKPKGVYSFKQHALDVIGLLEALDIKNAHFIGTSYGGEVGLYLAVSHKKYVKSLSVINSVSELNEVLTYFVLSWRDLALKKDGEKFFWSMMPSIYHSDFIKENKTMLKERAKSMNDIGPSYFDGQIALYDTFLNDLNLTKELKNIECPVLIVCGENDILKPRKFSDIIQKEVKHAEYALIPNCAHVTIFEKPDVLNSLLLGFIIKNY
ncbi:alpha/beta fold hydrolase [Liberiplasma polymorphum]|uniref:alpha/beta fold hydrolase n=1 Tax=Liberiplasma polymorphum TaxID=3374570 RepID=UPI003772500E